MDTPPQKTLVLQPGEWRALTLFSLHALSNAFEQIANLNDDGAAQAQMLLDRSRQLIEAWRRASRLAEAETAPPPIPEPAPLANGPVKVDITKDATPNRAERRRQRRREIPPTH